MQQYFNNDRSWLWIVNAIVYIAVIIIYFCVDGRELVYSMYLPLDAILNLAKAIYYFASQLKDKRERAKQAELARLL